MTIERVLVVRQIEDAATTVFSEAEWKPTAHSIEAGAAEAIVVCLFARISHRDSTNFLSAGLWTLRTTSRLRQSRPKVTRHVVTHEAAASCAMLALLLSSMWMKQIGQCAHVRLAVSQWLVVDVEADRIIGVFTMQPYRDSFCRSALSAVSFRISVNSG